MYRHFTAMLLLGIGLSMPLLGEARTIIANQTDDPTTISVGELCSSRAAIIVQPHTTAEIPPSAIAVACAEQEENCIAEVHMSDDCSEPSIATLILNLTTDHTDFVPHQHENFSSSFDGETLTINSK